MEDTVRLYDSAPVLCRKCLEIPVGERELAEALDRYLEKLPAEVRVPPEVYEARLALCADCPAPASVHLCQMRLLCAGARGEERNGLSRRGSEMGEI